jgi:hypothetical protein
MNQPRASSATSKLDLRKATLRPLTEVELWATAGAGDESTVLERNKRIME